MRRFRWASTLTLGLTLLVPATALAQSTTEKANQCHELAKYARQLADTHHESEAIAVFQQAARLDPNPNSAAVHLNCGLLFTAGGDHQAALEEYRKALQYEPGMPEAMLNLASTYQSIGDTPAAESSYNQFLLAHPNHADSSFVTHALSALQGGKGKSRDQKSVSQNYFDSITAEGKFVWSPSAMPIRVFLSNDPRVRYFSATHRRALESAFEAWSEASSGKIAVEFTTDKRTANIICSWSANSLGGYSGIESGLTKLAYDEVGSGLFEIRSASIVLRTTAADGHSPESDENIQRRCLHEVGHALGLRGHSPYNGDVLFFSESTSMPLSPSARDAATICKLYSSARISSSKRSQGTREKFSLPAILPQTTATRTRSSNNATMNASTIDPQASIYLPRRSRPSLSLSNDNDGGGLIESISAPFRED